MKIVDGYIDCSKRYPNSQRKKPFYAVRYSLFYNSDENDKQLIDFLIEKAKRLANNVVANAANNSLKLRNSSRVFSNCLAGVISEHFWLLFLNKESEVVSYTTFTHASNQIDLEIIKTHGKIEVRSSFPRKGVEFAICDIHQFKIIGPYSNSYKNGEVKKDFYVGALFHLNSPEEIINKVKQDGFSFFLTGGATWDMMWDDTKAIISDLTPDDAFAIQLHTSYRVVPYSNALDTKEVKEAIYKSIDNLVPTIDEIIENDKKFISHLPLYSIKAACGYFGNGDAVDELGWIRVRGLRLDRNMFVVKAVGHSMEPRINDGDYCVFRTCPAGSREGKIILAQHHGYFDEDNAGAYSIKEYHSQKTIDEYGNWQHEEIVLQPLNKAYNPIVLTPNDIDDFRIVGEFLGVLRM